MLSIGVSNRLKASITSASPPPPFLHAQTLAARGLQIKDKVKSVEMEMRLVFNIQQALINQLGR